VQLTQRIVQHPTATSLFATLTVQSCEPTQIRTTAKELIAGWDKLVGNRQTRTTGTYRWLEVTADEHQPWLENVHVHAALAMAPSYTGRNYLSATDWQEIWHESIGSSVYRSADVQRVRVPAAVAGYMSALDKFLADAELGTQDPERHITRTEQMKGLPRYRGVGSLGDGPQIEGIWSGDNWKRGIRQLERRVNHPGYVPIPIEELTT
jgi:hypothetical protein